MKALWPTGGPSANPLPLFRSRPSILLEDPVRQLTPHSDRVLASRPEDGYERPGKRALCSGLSGVCLSLMSIGLNSPPAPTITIRIHSSRDWPITALQAASLEMSDLVKDYFLEPGHAGASARISSAHWGAAVSSAKRPSARCTGAPHVQRDHSRSKVDLHLPTGRSNLAG